MAQFDDKTIRETAYYIWKNNGCPHGTSSQDWNAAVDLLERKEALAAARTVSSLYKAYSMNAGLKINLKKSAVKNLKMPYLLSKAFSQTVVPAGSAIRKSTKSK